MKKQFACLLLFSVVALLALPAHASAPLLMQQPTMSKDSIAFAYAGEIWAVPRQGGVARLLTNGGGIKSGPMFSPDGSMIAFNSDFDGNIDVYVMPGTGGIAKRLTHHPSADEVVGWSPDSKQVLFRSLRNSYSRFRRLFTVSVDGGLPHELPLPMAEYGAFSPDAKRVAYVPVDNSRRSLTGAADIAWKRYHGGKTSRIWLVSLDDLSLEKLPHQDWNDACPIWVGDKIYFLSDRNGPYTLYSFDLKTQKVSQAVPSNGADIKSASAGPAGIVYEQLGSISVYDPATGKSSSVPITIATDLPNVHPGFKKVEQEIAAARLSPSGARVVFEAHGEVLTAPAEKGDIRNLTNTSGVMERDPAWSPDGKWIAYFSDESGEYQLVLKGPDGMGEAKKVSLGTPPSFFYKPTWSPDSKKIAYTDKRLNLWYVDLAKAVPVKVDSDTYEAPQRSIDPVWSPDSRWIAYTKTLVSNMHAVFAYSIEEGKPLQLTDGLSDARFPAFDQKGQYLYFTASTDAGPSTGWLDLSSFGRQYTRSPYLIVLRKDQPSPLAPESDEEGAPEPATPDADKPAAKTDQPPMNAEEKAKAEDAKPAKAAKAEAVNVRIDMDGISQRILALPIPPKNYVQLTAGKAGTIFLVENSVGFAAPPTGTVWRFDLAGRKPEKMLEGIQAFDVSFDGKKVLYAKGAGENRKFFITSAVAPARGDAAGAGKPDSPLELAHMEVLVDPRAEWKQEYNEVWRLERDFFYDPNLHGLNLEAARKHYAQFVETIGSRNDFTYLLNDMLGELTVGHMYITTPVAVPPSGQGKVGLLGAEYKIENGRYRFSHIYQGENWNPQLHSPLTQPGVNVHEGDYLFSVNGRELRGNDEIFELFAGTADKSTVLKVGPTPDGKGARNVTVVPVDTELALRNRAWIEGNLRKVDQLSNGRVAYVYFPDTGGNGYTSFNRYFFAQVGREGAVLDERFNGGGAVPDYFIDYLRRPVQSYWTSREGRDFIGPRGAIFGPKVMIVNMYAGSGGDALPWMFRDAKLGPIVGTRTWGGLVGIYGTPPLMDGGAVTTPRVAFYNRNGQWEIENHGVDPDVEVELTPQDWMHGRDPQLEKSVALVMDSLRKDPLPVAKKPAYPNYHQAMPSEGVPAAAAGSAGNNNQ